MLTKNNFSLTHFFFLCNQTLENTENYIYTSLQIDKLPNEDCREKKKLER